MNFNAYERDEPNDLFNPAQRWFFIGVVLGIALTLISHAIKPPITYDRLSDFTCGMACLNNDGIGRGASDYYTYCYRKNATIIVETPPLNQYQASDYFKKRGII